jgi:uncharacterized alkaline shock family protein YloU
VNENPGPEEVPEQEEELPVSFQELPALAAESGIVHISEEVVGTIAGIAAMEIEGVAGLTGGFVGGITEMLGRRNFTRGVRVSLGEREAAVDLNIVVDYGVRIPKIAERVQETVKSSIENMTGLEVVVVNIHVQGVAFESNQVEELGT